MMTERGGRGSGGREGGRSLKTRVKTARKRSLSSTLWLSRQLNDPYVAQAKRDGLRSRSRHHVHLSRDVATALVVGRRRSVDVAIFEVATGEMAAAGHVFHLSDNGVWLTASVPAAFLSLKRTNQ